MLTLLLDAAPSEPPRWIFELGGTILFSVIGWLISRGVKANDDKSKQLAEQNADQGRRISQLESDRASMTIKLDWLNTELQRHQRGCEDSVDMRLFEERTGNLRADLDQCLFQLGRKPSTGTVRAMISGSDQRVEPDSNPPVPPATPQRRPPFPSRPGNR
jgi:hypothetical protein